MSDFSPLTSDEDVMLRAIELAQQGIGYVEPNPAVGAVLVLSLIHI